MKKEELVEEVEEVKVEVEKPVDVIEMLYELRAQLKELPEELSEVITKNTTLIDAVTEKFPEGDYKSFTDSISNQNTQYLTEIEKTKARLECVKMLTDIYETKNEDGTQSDVSKSFANILYLIFRALGVI